jgi:hypothetical protein
VPFDACYYSGWINQQDGTRDKVHKGANDFALQTVGNWTSD